MRHQRDQIQLWRDSSLPDGLELLRASCFEHRYPAHFHDEFVIAAFARGAQRHRVARYEGIAEAGTVMVIAPGEVHTGSAAQQAQGWDYCAFYPSARFLKRIADDVLGEQGEVEFGTDVLRHDPDLARRLLQASVTLATAKDVLERECAAFEALGTVIARYGQRTVRMAGPSATAIASGVHVAQAIDFLHAFHHRPVAVSEVASAVGMSEFHLMRTFRARTGLSVHGYLTQIRLIRAKALLARHAAAADVALSVGFYDQSHFIRQFRTHFGLTPGSFAKACR
ncbi:AraC family transcriptional regulator [Variovorax paradoxus]|jgi:AraC-like DNA-binding protein|uniref:AraC family transcriptional regulator n=1 Tax=Variovorax paradoxus TaxID=34073 RepID=UPI0029C8CF97|nr:AraC family transcriptional regulator [Variovorax paradoxus]WPH23071.1 AraC family transcriptional regulator [Variovorax paradoxus]